MGVAVKGSAPVLCPVRYHGADDPSAAAAAEEDFYLQCQWLVGKAFIASRMPDKQSTAFGCGGLDPRGGLHEDAPSFGKRNVP